MHTAAVMNRRARDGDVDRCIQKLRHEAGFAPSGTASSVANDQVPFACAWVQDYEGGDAATPQRTRSPPLTLVADDCANAALESGVALSSSSSLSPPSRPYTTLVALASVLLLLLHQPHSAHAHPHYATKIPNGNDVFDAQDGTDGGRLVAALGHVISSGHGPLNPFGVAFHRAGRTWTRALCEADSDADGRSNGAELGDPTCSWKENHNGEEEEDEGGLKGTGTALSWEEKERERWQKNGLMEFGLLLTHPGVANDWTVPVRPRPIEVQAARELRRRLARLRLNLTPSTPLVDGILLVGGQNTGASDIAQAAVGAATAHVHLIQDEQAFAAALAGDDGGADGVTLVAATGNRSFLLTDRMQSLLRVHSTNIVVVEVIPAHPHTLAHPRVMLALDGDARHVVTLHRDSWGVGKAAQWILDTLLAPATTGECRAGKLQDDEDYEGEDGDEDWDADGDEGWDGFTED